MKEGLLGLFLFLGHWLSPETDKASLDAFFVKNDVQYIEFQCQFDIAWNDQLEQLVDAGIPLRFNIVHYIDSPPDTIAFTRTLYCDMVNFTYFYVDSSETTLEKSHTYSLVQLALRDFCRWNFYIDKRAISCKIEAAILPGVALQLNRVIDMSRVWGQQKVFCQFSIQDKVSTNAKKSRKSR